MHDSRHLPPLDSLRYFEASARHGSFTRAAQELCLTQSAVSQKILALEGRLGYPLFERLPRGLRLTSEGGRLLQGVSAAFELLTNTMQTIRSEAQEGTLKVRVMPSFAKRWLMPRLPRFSAAYPNIRLLIDGDMTPANFKADEVDVAVSCEWTDNTRLLQLQLFEDVSYPVVNPQLQEVLKLKDYTDLARTQLLHDSLPQANYSTNWDVFFTRISRFDVSTRGGAAFSPADLVIQAACGGQGVSLARHSLCADDLAEGRLMRPFPDVIQEGAVYLVCPLAGQTRPRVAAFIEWMRAEAEDHVRCRDAALQLSFDKEPVAA